jgi:hypothetical protein
MSLGDRGIFQDVFGVIGYEPVQLLLLLIDAFQDSSGCEKFERATHREAFLRSVVKTFAATSIQGGDTYSAAQSLLDGRNLICRITSRARHIRGEQQNQNGYHR